MDTASRKGITDMNTLPNIVLVHGAWADGSCWSAVIERLQADGYNVTAPQFPESSLADDVARLRQVLDRQDGPTIVAGHSYGGQIMTALGTDAPNVAGLVYIAAFGLDEGESIGGLLAQGPSDPCAGPPGHRQAGLRLAAGGRLRPPLRGRRRPGPGQGHVRRAAAPGRVHLRGRHGRPRLEVTPVLVPGRRNDQAIPPDAERQFAKRMGATTIEVPTSHVAMVSHPDEVAQLIETAAQAVQAAN